VNVLADGERVVDSGRNEVSGSEDPGREWQREPRQGAQRYKTRVDAITPPSARSSLGDLDSCFFGISLENANFTPPKLASMANWIAGHFKHCTVLVGDSIHRITLAMTNSSPEPDATRTALRLGDEFIDGSRAIFDAVEGPWNVDFLRCSEVQEWREYSELHEAICDCFERDADFRASVETFGRVYNKRRSADLPQAQVDDLVRLSSAYFLEEFAVFAALRRRHGLSVMVYPGSFSTLAEIAAGKYESVPRELRDLTVVSIDAHRYKRR
jgi:tRNA-dependent cyclodipeptide synthase